MQRKLCLAALTLAVLGASAAQAGSIVIDASGLSAGSLLSSGQHTGNFDLQAAIGGRFSVTSASYLFSFVDDADAWNLNASNRTQSMTGYSYQGGSWSLRQRTETQSNSWSRDGESVAVSLGSDGWEAGSAQTANNSWQTSSDQSYLGRSYDYSSGGCGRNYCSYHYYYTDSWTQTVDSYQDATGSLQLAGLIEQSGLLQEMETRGLLDFSFLVGGDLHLDGAQLRIDYELLPAQDGTVAEPAALALAGAGLLAALLGGRRRSRQRQPG